MPNVFLMAAIENVPYNIIKKSNVTKVRNIISYSLESSKSSIIRLVDEYQASIRNISIPGSLVFLKLLSDHHADTLRHAISS
jgi:hypothetical protein